MRNMSSPATMASPPGQNSANTSNLSLANCLPPKCCRLPYVRAMRQGLSKSSPRMPSWKRRLNEPMANYGDSGMQPILAAVQRSDRETIDVLLKAGADIDARSHGAARGVGVLDECGPDFASFLMERGAARCPLRRKAGHVRQAVREFITANPAVVNARGANGQSVLHFATTIEIADYLLNHGANIGALLLHVRRTRPPWNLENATILAATRRTGWGTQPRIAASLLGDGGPRHILCGFYREPAAPIFRFRHEPCQNGSVFARRSAAELAGPLHRLRGLAAAPDGRCLFPQRPIRIGACGRL